MAISGKAAARSLASRGMKPSSDASKATKTAFTKEVNKGSFRVTKGGNIEMKKA